MLSQVTAYDPLNPIHNGHESHSPVGSIPQPLISNVKSDYSRREYKDLNENENSGINVQAYFPTNFSSVSNTQASGQDQKMEPRRFIRDLFSYSSKINQLIEQNKLEEAWSLWEQMLNQGIEPNLIVCNTLMKLHKIKGDLSKAVDLLVLMRVKGITPDTITYNNLIQICGKSGLPEKGLAFLREMQQTGVRPDIATYNNLIYSYIENKQLLKSAYILEEMWEAGIMPDIMTYNVLLRCYAKYGTEEEVQTFLNRMRVEWDKITYDILIKYC